MAQVEAILGIIGGAGSIGWGIWKKGIQPVLKKEKKKKEEFYRKMDEMHAELKFNGGTTLKDVVFEIKGKVNNIENRMDDFDQNQKLAMNLQGIAFWVSDEKGECTYASPGLCKVMGRSESEILGSTWMGWLHPDDKDRIVKAWSFAIENKTPFDEIYTFKKANGKWQKVWGQAFPKIAKNNVFGGILGKLVAMEESHS